MRYLRLVAYHNFETERESITFGTLESLCELAEKTSTNKYPDHYLMIEDNGSDVAKFIKQGDKFVRHKKQNNDED